MKRCVYVPVRRSGDYPPKIYGGAGISDAGADTHEVAVYNVRLQEYDYSRKEWVNLTDTMNRDGDGFHDDGDTASVYPWPCRNGLYRTRAVFYWRQPGGTTSGPKYRNSDSRYFTC